MLEVVRKDLGIYKGIIVNSNEEIKGDLTTFNNCLSILRGGSTLVSHGGMYTFRHSDLRVIKPETLEVSFDGTNFNKVTDVAQVINNRV